MLYLKYLFRYIAKWFEVPPDHCVCHDNGKQYIHKGGVIQASCEHCYAEPIATSGTWGTPFP